MPQWLIDLTQPEDQRLWAWLVIVVGYALVGLMLGRRALGRRSSAATPPEDTA